MINVAKAKINNFEEFEIEQDILFFKMDERAPGLVSFHGKNYNMKKRMSFEQMNLLQLNDCFFQVNSTCFVNINKIKLVENAIIYFGETFHEDKHITVSIWKQQRLKQLVNQRNNQQTKLG